MLLYVIKQSRSVTSTLFRGLTKCMDGATMADYLEMLRVINLVLDKETFV